MPSVPSDAILTPGSLVLVTGANGFVACHTADQLLNYGYHVRGTVRDLQKSAWVKEYFDKKYGAGKFELVCVKDLGARGALDEAVQGCQGFTHVATNLTLSPDPNIVVKDTLAFTEHALESALKEPGLKRFVLTSSSSAANQMKMNEVYDVTAESWNETSVENAWRPPPYGPDRIMAVYDASKVASEKALWAFVKEKKPHFVANSVLPDFVAGERFSEQQGWPSTLGTLKAMYDGGDLWKLLMPQYMIDAHDTGRLHVIALIHPDVKSERLFGYAHNKTWTDWIARFKKMYPDHTWPEPVADEGVNKQNIVAAPRAESLLRWLGQPGWRPMEDSMREAMDSVIAGST